MKKIKLMITMITALCIFAGCGSRIEEADAEEEVLPDFELTEGGKAFLESMCMLLPDFSGEEDMNEAFWKDFIFFGYTASEGEFVMVYRDGLGFEEQERKVSAGEVSEYAELAFGRKLPDIKPTFEAMGPTQTALYYDDGYYYIGVSDFPDFQFLYESFDVHEESGDTYAVVTYTINFEDEENAGTVTLQIIPADNENGFVITSKEMVIQ